MKGFKFEKNLTHQSQAVESTFSVFENIPVKTIPTVEKNYTNPEFDFLSSRAYPENIRKIQLDNGIDQKIKRGSNIIDIMMETGTGKTYTYTKTIFELNKRYGVFKFIVVVPTLSIKAGTINFLKSDSCREHFKEQYGKTLHLHIVESQKRRRNKKSFLPPAVTSFVNAGRFEKNSIQVMVINSGMITSDTMAKSFDRQLFDKYAIPLEAIAAVKPFMIIDEPHKFKPGNKAWRQLLKMKPQFILRYGATFPEKKIKQKDPLTGKKKKAAVKDYQNLIYVLNAVDSFNRNLVKGVIGHITEYAAGKNALVRLVSTDGKEANFELTENGKKTNIKLAKKESLNRIHPQMTDLCIEKLNKSTVALSNGLDLKRGDKINPYSYAEKLQETMIQKAVTQHFEIEKQLLGRDVKIKPLTLFFIDNIDEYRNKGGYVRKILEQSIQTQINELLTDVPFDAAQGTNFYKSYLEKTLEDISLTHAGYFSKDNTGKDKAVEKEINEILHDKQAILSLENPRRFIFSKWTLREGWDNPNVFQICKLRSSGSDISKLQEVGRGLRLPVNEFGNRVKDEPFFLNYCVDFTESNFVDQLVDEINEKSDAFSIEQDPEKLSDDMIKKICELYETTEDELLERLDDNNVITRTNLFTAGGFDYIKQNYPRIFEGVNSNRIRKASDPKKQITVRTEKYKELKTLWEKLNEKVILEYKFESEEEFKILFTEFLKECKDDFTVDGLHERVSRVEIEDNSKAVAKEPDSVYNRSISTISTIKYSDFLKQLSKSLTINIKTIHQSIKDSGAEINSFLNPRTLRAIKQNFNDYLMANAIDKFSIEYKKVSNSIHPTKLTDANGQILKEVSASNIGRKGPDDEPFSDKYLFDELYYDSELEKTNIETDIKEVVVFTKIPQRSIKIPIAGGGSYSPDFAYVLKYKDGKQKLHFIVETKDVNSNKQLRDEERYKIKHAEKFFDSEVKIQFRTQFSNKKMVDLIKEIVVD